MEKVDRRGNDGVHSLAAIMQMLRNAALDSGGKVTGAAPTMEEWGVSFTIGNGIYWTGLNYDESEVLLFRACGHTRNRAQENGSAPVRVSMPNKDDSPTWSNRLDLESERVRFFAKTKSNQIECIEHFLRKSIRGSTPALRQAQKIA